MIKLLRNSEVKKALAVQIFISIVAVLIALYFRKKFAFFTLMLCLAFILIYLFTTYKRYKSISSLTYDIDHILHDDGHIFINNFSEGELSILQSEICKMTIRLKEQQQTLKNEKIYLADSLADISHQIRTPLTSVNLLVSLISEPNITNERRKELSHDLYELLSKIDWLITTLLKISKLDAGTVNFKPESITLTRLIQKATFPLLIPIELKNQTLKISAEGALTGDFLWTCEAVTNIVKNCMEHTPKNGVIEIEAFENALFTEIIIKDNGAGIKKEDLPHIFERFYKGENSNDKGFGIGLALSRMIITAQNGTIKAENRFSGGAKFTIRFYKSTI